MTDRTPRTHPTPKMIGRELAKSIRFDPRALVELKITGRLTKHAIRNAVEPALLEQRVCVEIQKRPIEAMNRLKERHQIQPPIRSSLTDREHAIRSLFLRGRDWCKIRKLLSLTETEIEATANGLSKPEILMAKLARRMIQIERAKF